MKKFLLAGSKSIVLLALLILGGGIIFQLNEILRDFYSNVLIAVVWTFCSLVISILIFKKSWKNAIHELKKEIKEMNEQKKKNHGRVF